MIASSQNAASKVPAIESLRFIAAFLVVLYHSYWSQSFATDEQNEILRWFKNGWMGVDVFFVISGFVMYVSAVRRTPFNFASFMMDRFWRIYPVLWIILTLKIAIDLVAAYLNVGSINDESMSAVNLVLQYTLFPLSKDILLIPPTWTLTVEMVFYLAFAAGYFWWRLKGVAVLVITWFLAANGFLATGGERTSALGSTIFNPVIIEFLYGSVIGYLFVHGKMRWGKPILGMGILACLAVFLFHGVYFDLGLPRWLRAGVPAALLIYGLAAVSLPSSSWLELGGRASYVLYLSHTMILGATAAVLGKALQVDVWNNGYWFILPILASLIFAVLFNVLIETRIQAWRQRQKQAKLQAAG